MARRTLGVLFGLAAFALSGCSAWRVESTPTAQLLAEKPLQTIRVTTVDSIDVTLHQPRVVGDSVTGHPTATAVERRTIHLRDIAAVATKHPDIGKSLFAAAAIVGGVVVYGLLQSLNSTP
jgi:hypothetical protein